MANALTPTVWFSDYWSEYAPIAQANAARAFELARSVGDPDLLIDAEFAVQRTLPAATVKEAGEDLLARLEARRDLVRLKEHCFWMMWVYFGRGGVRPVRRDLRPRAGARHPTRIGSGAVRVDQGDRAQRDAAGSTRSRPPSPRRSPTTTTRSDTRSPVWRAPSTSPRWARWSRPPPKASRRSTRQRWCRAAGCSSGWSTCSRRCVYGSNVRDGRFRPHCRTSSTTARSVARWRLGPRSSWPTVAPTWRATCSSRSWPGSRARDGSASCSRPGSSTRRRRSPTATPPARSVSAAPRSPLRWTLATRRSPGGCASCWHSPPRRRGTRRRPRSSGPVRPLSSARCAIASADPALRTAFEQDAPDGFDQAS